MKRSALSYFSCTNCRASKLDLRESERQGVGDDIGEGLLVCPQCSATYPIQNRIVLPT